MRLFDIGSDGVVVSALYPQGDEAVLRLYEYRGRAISMEPRYHGGRFALAELNGVAKGPLPATLPVGAWQILTLLAKRA